MWTVGVRTHHSRSRIPSDNIIKLLQLQSTRSIFSQFNVRAIDIKILDLAFWIVEVLLAVTRPFPHPVVPLHLHEMSSRPESV